MWSAPTTTDRDRKELLRTLLEEVVVAKEPGGHCAHLTLRWRGGALTQLDVDLPQPPNPTLRTDEGTVDLIRRLAAHYQDSTIAGILNRQGRRTVRGERFTAASVGSIRRYRKIPSSPARPQEPEEGRLVNVAEAARILDVTTSTVHRWLNDGFIVGEQLTPGAPWRIRITQDFRARFVEQAPEGWVGMLKAMNALAVSRQTVLQRVKRGELETVYVRQGRRKGLRIKLPEPQQTLFDDHPRIPASEEEPREGESNR